MLHIVQVVLSGVAEVPKLTFDGKKAEATYVECAKKYWPKPYAAYCERCGVSSDEFTSAQAFVNTFDLADRSKIYHWVVRPADVGLGDAPEAKGALSDDQREVLLRLTRDVEQTTRAVKEGMAEFLEEISCLTGYITAEFNPVADPPEAEAAAAIPSAEPEQVPEQSDTEKYETPEWKSYVSTVRSLCGGPRNEYRLFSRHDWRQDVYSSATSFEYFEWLADSIDKAIATAHRAGYTVEKDASGFGYRFRSPGGEPADATGESESEAWCQAGLHAQGRWPRPVSGELPWGGP